MEYNGLKNIANTAKRLVIFVALLSKHLLFELGQYLQITFYQYKYSKSQDVMLSRLRVMTHALDKGLCTSTRQSGRGNNKYKECINLINKLSETEASNEPSLIWAREKVKEYEHAQTSNLCLERESFQIPTPDERHKLLRFIRSRRSVRAFKSKIIESDILSEIVDAARWAPNSCCRQAVFFYVNNSQEQNHKCMALTLGATCFGEVIPCFICVCGDTRFYPLADKGLLYIDGALAVENLLLAAHAFGIEGTILNWRPHMRKNEIALRKKLIISPYHSIIVNIALGYPDFIPPAPARIILNDVWKLTGDD